MNQNRFFESLLRRFSAVGARGPGCPAAQIEPALLGVLAGAGVGILTVDGDGRCLTADATAARLLETAEARLKGRDLSGCLPAAPGHSSFEEALAMALEENGYQNAMAFLPAGSRWIRAHIYPAARGATVLITDRSRAMAEWTTQEHSERQFRAFVDSCNDAIAVTKEDRITYVNPAFVATFGADPTRDGGDHWARFITPDDRPRVEEYRKAMARGEGCGPVAVACVREDGTGLTVEASASTVHLDGDQGVLVCLRDITDRLLLEEQLEEKALYDGLTGLPNRALLLDRLATALAGTRRSGEMAALLMADLNGFKEVNDTFGHPIGDRVLQQVATRFKGAIRDVDTVARLGGDEFALVLPRIESVADAEQAADRLLQVLEDPIRIDEVALHVGVSIGIALGPLHGGEGESLMRLADAAMYQAKREHTGFAVSSEVNRHDAPARLALARELREGIHSGQLRLHYQPVVDPYTSRVRHLEALVRWEHPERGLIPPSDFIPLAEQTGLIRPLTEWVLNEAAGQVATWAVHGTDTSVAVNVSVQHLQDADFPDQIASTLARWDIPATKLRLEVTEEGLVTNLAKIGAATEALEEMGVAIAIDDFGTGHAAFGYLRGFRAREIKIDRSFVMAARENPWDAALVRSMIDMAGALGKTVIAEGVEDKRSLAFLMAAGCDAIQGYYFSRPVPAGEVPAVIARIEAACVRPRMA